MFDFMTLSSADIFISYSRKDVEFAQLLHHQLEQKGLSAWLDTRSIRSGAEWEKAIKHAIAACSAFIVVVTPHSADSKWVQTEVNIALSIQTVQKNGLPDMGFIPPIRIIPFWLSGEKPWRSLQKFQYVDVRSGEMPSDNFYAELKQFVEFRKPIVEVAATEYLKKLEKGTTG